MTTFDSEYYEYAMKEIQREINDYKSKLTKKLDQDLSSLVFVGSEEMRKHHYDRVRDNMMKDLQDKVKVREVLLEKEHLKSMGGSREAAEKHYNLEQNPDKQITKEKANEKYAQSEKLKSAGEDLRQNWERHSKKPDRGLER